MKNIYLKNYKNFCFCIISSTSLLTSNSAWSEGAKYNRQMSQIPPSFNIGPKPNVFVTLDDSRSMMGDSVPHLTENIKDAIDLIKPKTKGDDYEIGHRKDNPLMWLRFNVKDNPDADEPDDIFRIAQLKGVSTFMSPAYYSEKNPIARYMRSADGNPLYYNPKISYIPWPSYSGDKYNAAKIDNVIIHPYDPEGALKLEGDGEVIVDGEVIKKALDKDANKINLRKPITIDGESFWPATYFVYNSPDKPPKSFPINNPLDKTINIEKQFTKFELGRYTTKTYTKHPNRTDCKEKADVCTTEEELQNFANWLQYYRSRSLMVKGGLLHALATQKDKIRLGFTRLNAVNESDHILLKVRDFSNEHYDNVFSAINDTPVAEGTPLRKVAGKVGEYFRNDTKNGPWSSDPTIDEDRKSHLWCRRSYHILTTDGLWNGPNAENMGDGHINDWNTKEKVPSRFAGTIAGPNDEKYTFSNLEDPGADPLANRFTIYPFYDRTKNTLADVTSFYWKFDLRPDLPNTLPPTSQDPAFWQHLSTSTIGIGIGASGNLKDDKGNPVDISTKSSREMHITNETKIEWPKDGPVHTENDPAKGDDLIHAAMSSRGDYFQANDPQTLNSNLQALFNSFTDITLQGAGLAIESLKLGTNDALFQATFNPSGWYGRLYAFRADGNSYFSTKPTSDGHTNAAQRWEASNKMPPPADRVIFTLTKRGVNKFLYENLDSDQKLALNEDPDIVDYLRGSDTKELANGGHFRDRVRYNINDKQGGVLGAIINSIPLKGPTYGVGYKGKNLEGSDQYDVFRKSTAAIDIQNTLFVGANDGMFHAFNSNTGKEIFAYVPQSVYSVPRATPEDGSENRLAMLSTPGYSHRYTVDGTPNIADAFIGREWKSILVSSTGAGARSVFAIDASRNLNSESQVDKNQFLWELNDQGDPDLGFVPGYPHIALMKNGVWAAIFGNGPDSYNGDAVLYIVNLKNGNLIRKISVDKKVNNALMQPNFTLNEEREVEAIYAGDLNGNLWKFDVSSVDPAEWSVAYNEKPIFTATGPNGKPQPISVMPEITAGPNNKGAMIIFGTGKYFEEEDRSEDTEINVNLQVQSAYGIWDNPDVGRILSNTDRNTVLVNRSFNIDSSNTNTDATFAISSKLAQGINPPPTSIDWTKQRGWFMDFRVNFPDMVNLNPQQIRNVVFLVVNTPSVGTCATAGSNMLIALDPINGTNPSTKYSPVFDVNRNGIFNQDDKYYNVKLNYNGMLTQPIFTIPERKDNPDTPSTEDFLKPLSIFDRGQTSAARAGGVQLGYLPPLSSAGPAGSPGSNPCMVTARGAGADGSVMAVSAQVCAGGGTPRISWRQLR